MPRSLLRPVVHGLRSVLGTNGLAERLALVERRVTELAGREPAPALPVPPPAPPMTPAPAPAIDVNLMLHHSRGAMLRMMPPGAQRLLSAGCAGRWYFDWVEQCYGRVAEHIGIEAYAPRPDDLPDNVTWIANTVSDMSDVADASCDLVFSGQNLEHLWPEEMSGFLAESARVLRPGGHLVIDSPNRELTAALNWSHPEHTVELSVDEIIRALELAGFVVVKLTGIWLCRDPRSGRVPPFQPSAAEPDWSVTERLVAAYGRPREAFIWWMEARRTEQAPDTAGLDLMMGEIFRRHWPERLQRLVVPEDRETELRDGENWVRAARGHAGLVLHGPGMPLRAGRYCVEFELDSGEEAGAAFAACEVVGGTDHRILARQEVHPKQRRVRLAFAITSLLFGVEFRCLNLGGGGFAVRRRILLEEYPA